MNINPDFTAGLMSNLSAAALVDIVKNSEGFIKNLIANLDASAINAATGASTLYTYEAGGPKGMFYDLVKPVSQGGLDPVKVADIINSPSVANFVGALMGHMDPSQTAGLLSTPNGEAFLKAVLDQIQGSPTAEANIAAVLSNPAGVEMMHQLYLALADPSVLGFLVSKINAAGPNSVLRYLTLAIESPVGAAVDVPGAPIPMKIQISGERQYVVPLEVAVREYPLPW